TTDDHNIIISNVEEDATYTIQVVASHKNSDTLKSEAATTTLTIEPTEEEVPPVSNLQASYNESSNTIDVTWDYNGPDAQYEVSVGPTGNVQNVQGQQLEITNVQPGTTYSISVTPISLRKSIRGP